MKKFLKILGIVIGALVVMVIIFVVYINASGIPTYEVETISFQHESSPEAIQRGKILTTTLCSGCHLGKQTGKLTGKKMLDIPAEFGEIYSPNITQDPTYGIGNWTDGEIVYLLRTGIKRDGNYAPPYMPKLPLMADEDINAIVAFLRSEHPLVTASSTPDTPSDPSFLAKLLCHVEFKPFPMPEEPIAMPDTSNTIELGEYLAHNLDCYACHSADFTTNDYLNPPKSVGYFGGGNKPLDEEGRIVLTSNLTPDATGIGDMSKKQFVKAVRYGIKEGEPALQFPMQPYAALSAYEVGAIYDYLQTIPPIDNKVERSIYD